MSEHDSLEQRLAALEAEVVGLRSQLADRAEIESPAPKPRSAAPLSRRKALARLGGVAAAAGVAATAATLATSVPSAKAADGDAVILGNVNFSTFTTEISDDGTANDASTFEVSGNGFAINGANTAIEALGTFGGIGVLGEGFDDTVNGFISTGVSGTSIDGDGTGVSGSSDSGLGVLATAGSGIGLLAASSTGWDVALAGTGRLFQLDNLGHPGPPTGSDGFYDIGERILDSNSTVWFSVLDPTAFVLRWVRPGVVNGGARGGAMNFLPSPVRIIGAGSPPGVALGKNTHTNFGLAGVAGIPADATAVFGNATVYNAGGSGFVTLTPQGGSASTSSLNFTSSDQPLSNFVAVGLNGGAISVFVSNNFNVKFIYDVVGYCL